MLTLERERKKGSGSAEKMGAKETEGSGREGGANLIFSILVIFSARTNKLITFACRLLPSVNQDHFTASPASGEIVLRPPGLLCDKTDGLPRYGCGLKGLVTLRSSDAYDPARRERSELDEGEGGEVLHSN